MDEKAIEMLGTCRELLVRLNTQATRGADLLRNSDLKGMSANDIRNEYVESHDLFANAAMELAVLVKQVEDYLWKLKRHMDQQQLES